MAVAAWSTPFALLALLVDFILSFALRDGLQVAS